jgi:hypothetical protein
MNRKNKQNTTIEGNKLQSDINSFAIRDNLDFYKSIDTRQERTTKQKKRLSGDTMRSSGSIIFW